MTALVKICPINTVYILGADTDQSEFVKFCKEKNLPYKANFDMFDIMNQMDFNLDLNYVFVTNPPFSKLAQLFKTPAFKEALLNRKFHYCLIVGMIGWTSEWAHPFNHFCNYYKIPNKLRYFIQPDGTLQDVHAVLVSDLDFEWPDKYALSKAWKNEPQATTSINQLNYYFGLKQQGYTFKICYRPGGHEFKKVCWTKRNN